ncbi:hypothetical protein [Mycolicibacterium sp. 624]|uniref:hypothetical protein n=1 Tax=Mycolicibacterium sp. 624 TaxID=3156314 RepID=UPI0033974D1D
MTVPNPSAPPVAIPATDSALMLDGVVNMVDLARADINTVLRGTPSDIGLFQALDLVTALGHLRQAVLLVDKVADVLEADAAAVVR